jgi:CheY-like chemotaxis protein
VEWAVSDKKLILLIDDDASLLVTLSDFLRFEGYEVQTAESGEEGLELLEGLNPDMIILDMSMPGMGGVGFLKEISDDQGRPRHPVLVLTARAKMAEFFANIQVEGFVAKPCDPDDLLMEVSRIVFLRGGESAGPRQPPSSGARVLVAEDDEETRTNVVKAMSDAGYESVGVGRSSEVLENAIIEKPDVIVMKLVLPGMQGDAVACMLKEMQNTQHIPVVLYDDSGIAKPGSVVEDGSPTVAEYLVGGSPEDIVAAVERVLIGGGPAAETEN